MGGREGCRVATVWPQDADLVWPGGLSSAVAAPGQQHRPGGAVHLPHLPGGVPLARDHWQLQAHLNGQAWGRWYGWGAGSASGGEELRSVAPLVQLWSLGV